MLFTNTGGSGVFLDHSHSGFQAFKSMQPGIGEGVSRSRGVITSGGTVKTVPGSLSILNQPFVATSEETRKTGTSSLADSSSVPKESSIATREAVMSENIESSTLPARAADIEKTSKVVARRLEAEEEAKKESKKKITEAKEAITDSTSTAKEKEEAKEVIEKEEKKAEERLSVAKKQTNVEASETIPLSKILTEMIGDAKEVKNLSSALATASTADKKEFAETKLKTAIRKYNLKLVQLQMNSRLGIRRSTGQIMLALGMKRVKAAGFLGIKSAQLSKVLRESTHAKAGTDASSSLKAPAGASSSGDSSGDESSSVATPVITSSAAT